MNKELVRVTVEDGVATIRVDNPPVNALSPGVPEGIASAMKISATNPNVQAIVLMGAGRTFVAGADIKELEEAAWGKGAGGPDLDRLLHDIEDCSKPVVMAIHGTALGGGLELAMAGHFRIAVPDASMGQPEVNLGIIPGAQGSQRLPRLVGVEKAIDMCVSGKPLKAPDALAAGILDAIVEGDLALEAATFARQMAARGGPFPKTSEKNDKLTAWNLSELLSAGRQLAKKTRRGMLAPLKVVDAIEAAATLPFEEGCRRERELFTECVKSEQCRALIHLFFAGRNVAKIPDIPKDTPAHAVERVAIIGSGTMGGGIAMACANAGIPVLLKDTKKEALDKGMETILRNYEVSVSRGRFTAEEVKTRMELIHPQLDYKGFESTDLVIEAVFENMDLKKKIFGEIDAIAPKDCILGSNTSTLNIEEIASATNRPQMVIGLHFFSPANVMRLLEIVRAKSSGKETVATAMAFAKRIGKTGVAVGNCPGFVGNRMMFPYMYEAQFLVEEGATPEQVDKALTEWGMAMGIFAVDDMAGLDVAWHVRQAMRHFSEPGVRAPLVAEKLYSMGRLGQKTGKGWYKYEDRKPTADPEVISLIEKTAKELGIARREFTDDEIIDRLFFALVIEGARALDEGFATRAADIDVIYVNGYGFPAWRGGPMFCADSIGLRNIYDRILKFRSEHGSRWEPAPLLKKLVDRHMTFREYDLEREEASVVGRL